MSEYQTRNRRYWDELADTYQQATRIATTDFHFGPLLPGDRELKVLPQINNGCRCLEIGCGGGQNSVYLASLGASCIAIDISAQQLHHGQQLAPDVVHFIQAGMDALPVTIDAGFDLIHSTYALPFSDTPGDLIRAAAKRLRLGGTFVLTTAHPIFAGEWLAIEDEGCGMFVENYFHPPADVRFNDADDDFIQSRAYPIETLFNWCTEASLTVTRVAEPQPVPIPMLTESEIAKRVPYSSPAWRELYDQLAHVPVVVVIVAKRLDE